MFIFNVLQGFGSSEAEYSNYSLYSGYIDKNSVVINIVNSKNIFLGSYMYDNYENKILLNGIANSYSLYLKKGTNNSMTTMTLTKTHNGVIKDVPQ